MATHYRRFRDISVSEKMLDTLFLITIGIGYLFALTHCTIPIMPVMGVQDFQCKTL